MEQTKIPQSARRFLAIAQQDLKAARCLDENNFYPQAVFYLEQSVEKGLKSFAIFAGIITEQETRHSISHQTMKIYSKTTVQFKERVDAIHTNPNLERMFEGIVNSSRLSTQLNGTLGFIQKVSKENVGTISKADKRLRNYLVGLRKLHYEYNDLQDLIQQIAISQAEFRAFKKMLLNMVKRYLEEQPDEFKRVKKEIDEKLTYDYLVKSTKDSLSVLIPPMFIYSSFFYLSRLLAPHALLRYPDREFDPLEFYTPQLPLIQEFSQICSYSDATLSALDQLYAPLSMEGNE